MKFAQRILRNIFWEFIITVKSKNAWLHGNIAHNIIMATLKTFIKYLYRIASLNKNTNAQLQ